MFYDPTGMFALATDGIYSLQPQGGQVEEINVFQDASDIRITIQGLYMLSIKEKNSLKYDKNSIK